MKRKKIIAPLLLVCVISLVVVLKNTQIDNSKYQVNYIQDGEENNLKIDKLKYEKLSGESPAEITTYETTKPNDTQKDVENILNIFGFPGKYEKVEDENIISFTVGEQLLEYYKNTGGVNYYNSSLMSSSKTINADELKNTRYYEKAEDILKKLGVNNVSRKNIVSSGITSGDSNNNSTEFKLLSVSFWRELDGRKIMGFDKIMFDFDANGDLASAMVSVRNYQTLEKVSINSSKKAFEKFKTTKEGYIGTDDLESTEAELAESELVYWIEEINKKQITKPIYSIKGRTLNSNKKSNDSVYIRINAIS